jgi:UDP-N-acetylglucosamine 2-epimerase (non-hydrolysing)
LAPASHAVQTAKVMMAFEEICLADRPRPGRCRRRRELNHGRLAGRREADDPIAHVEAGLRSFDRRMPEEINRIVTDRLADLLLTPSRDGNENLRAEGTPAEKIHLVGNVMIDTPAAPSAARRSRSSDRPHSPRRRAVRRPHAAPAVECRRARCPGQHS